jgi:hypothetical protein
LNPGQRMKQQTVEICSVTSAIMCTKHYWCYEINSNGVDEDVEGFRGEKKRNFQRKF